MFTWNTFNQESPWVLPCTQTVKSWSGYKTMLIPEACTYIIQTTHVFFWSAAQEGVQGECYTEHKWKRCSMVSPVYSSWTQNHKWPLNCTERVVCAQYFSSTPSAMSDLWTAQKESCVCNTSTQPPVQWVTSGLHKKSSVCAIPQLKPHAMSDLWTAQKELCVCNTSAQPPVQWATSGLHRKSLLLILIPQADHKLLLLLLSELAIVDWTGIQEESIKQENL